MFIFIIIHFSVCCFEKLIFFRNQNVLFISLLDALEHLRTVQSFLTIIFLLSSYFVVIFVDVTFIFIIDIIVDNLKKKNSDRFCRIT